jgi:hypothetical protein
MRLTHANCRSVCVHLFILVFEKNLVQLTEDADAAASESSIVAITFIFFVRSFFVLIKYFTLY